MTVEEWKRKNPPIQRKPITNADRLRAMTDEELAEWLDNNTYRFPIYKDWLEWLRQEATQKDGGQDE